MVVRRMQKWVILPDMDSFDGRIGTAFFDRKAAQWHAEQARNERSIQDHRLAYPSFTEERLAQLERAG